MGPKLRHPAVARVTLHNSISAVILSAVILHYCISAVSLHYCMFNLKELDKVWDGVVRKTSTHEYSATLT
jgi:hypothetical protein